MHRLNLKYFTAEVVGWFNHLSQRGIEPASEPLSGRNPSYFNTHLPTGNPRQKSTDKRPLDKRPPEMPPPDKKPPDIKPQDKRPLGYVILPIYQNVF